jgi:amino acid adenylation domain-containing protein
VDDDFFSLGGHSLLATRVTTRAGQAFGIELPLRALFEAPTIAGLAGRVDQLRGGGADAAPPPIVPVRREGELPLSFAQQRLWFIDRLEPGGSAYNVPAALRLRGTLDVEGLAWALSELVKRHEVLRTTFGPGADGEPVQVIHPSAPVELPVMDLSDRDAETRAAEVERLARDEAARPFDLARGPLMRSTLLRLGEDEAVALFTLHHVVSDGWSMEILVREVAALYAAYLAGQPSPLPDLPVQYADYAVWQRRWLRGAVLERQLEYWRQRLAGAPAVLELPTDRPRPAAASREGATHAFALSPELSRGLRELGRRQGATTFMTVLAGFQALLARYAGADDVVVGTPVAGRTRLETEGLIGVFVNALAIRTGLEGEPTFTELLGRVRQGVLEAQTHQDLPFERLVEALQVERSMAHTPLFQVVFTLDEAPRGDGGLGLRGVQAEALEVESATTTFDMVVRVTDTGDALAGRVTYRTDLFDAATIQRMAGHLARLLEAAVADPAARPAAVELLEAGERRRILQEWNATERAFGRDLPVHHRFEAQAARTPDAVAVEFGGGTVTYAELNARANRLARRLRREGVGPETIVALFLDRSPDVVVGIMGVLKAGGAYLPLDPAYPAERLRYMREDSGARVLVAHRALLERLGPAEAGTVLVLDAQAEALAAEDGTNLAPSAGPENLAYVIYTSGSTGRPKGAAIRHSSLVNYLEWFGEQVLGGQAYDLPLLSRLSFDAAVRQIFPPLLSGGRVRIIPEDVLREPVALARALGSGPRLVVGGVPSLWSMLLDAVEAGDAELPGLERVLLGGEALSDDLVARTMSHFPGVEIWNHYGPTEATVNTTALRVRPGERITLGRAVANVTLYVLDGAARPVPAGVPGELYVGGEGLGRGYLRRPALTADRFVPDAFSATPGARLYRSGDRVRWNAAGELEFLGRIDEQVKVRGYRIELGEVEWALAQHPGVRDAVVVSRGDGPGGGRLVAYVVGPAGVPELRAHLEQRLPDYMVPAVFVPLDALPLTPNGKVDRRALPAPEAGAQADGAYVAPSTPAETELAAIWGEVLGIDRVGVDDNFFELGGHSLVATRVVSRVRRTFGVDMPLRALFEAQTVRALAAGLDVPGAAVAGPPLVPVRRDRPLPLSFAQQRLWFIDQLEPGGSAYNLPVVLRMRGVLDAPALAWALGETVKRHEALRTTFAMGEDGEPVQVIGPPRPVPLPVVDLSALDDGVAQATGDALARDESARPFDLAAGPLFRGTLLRLGDRENTGVFVLHHVVSDEWSGEVLVRELSTLYGARVSGRTVRLPALPVQYADFALWQRRWLEGAVLDGQVEWWRERLAGAPAVMELPLDRARPAVAGSRGALHAFVLPAELARQVRELGRREGATPFMTLLAAWQALLSRFGAGDDVVVGTPVAGRTRLETEGLIGFFVNMLVIRTSMDGDPAFTGVVARVRDAVLEAQAHQEVPFERLVDALNVERSMAHGPLFQAVFKLDDARRGAASLDLPGVTLSVHDAGSTEARFDLQLSILSGAEGEALRCTLEYRTDLFDEATAERIAAAYERLLEGVAADPGAPVSTHPLLEGTERRRVLEAWNDTATEYPRGRTVHALFAQQAARTPDAPALEAGAERLTYAQLDRRADVLAARLRRGGVGPETLVALAVPRSAGLIVGVLGILKAGGAYLPLDPALPPARFRGLLEDAGARVLLTTEALREPLSAAAEGACPVALLEGADEIDTGAPAGDARVGPENLAYVMYTSGSTGRPKGVAVTHRNVVRLVRGADYARFGPDETFLQLAPASFDASTFEIWGALLNGARLVVHPPEAPSLEELAGFVRERSITTLWLTAGLFHQVADAHPDALAGVRQLLAGGDALSPPHVAKVAAALGGGRLINGYGPTECTTFACAWPVPAGGAGAGPVPVGGPIANARVYVVDAALAPVSVGAPGELLIGGDGVARGYLGRPALTAERFVPDPFGGAGGRLYRSGDRARWRSDGTLEVLGRMDLQVKVRGYRVEPGEVEGVLCSHPAVREAAVVARGDASGEKRLVAYLVGEDGPADVGAVRAWLRERLPDYMVPSAFEVMDALPLTPNGKVDRRALPEPGGGASSAGDYVAPRTAVEEVLALLLAELLAMERVGVHDDFFDLGGHSLLATRYITMIRETLQVELPLRALFEAPSIAGLAAALVRREAEPGVTERIARLVAEVLAMEEDEVGAAGLASDAFSPAAD